MVVALLGAVVGAVLLALDALSARSALMSAADRVPALRQALDGEADRDALEAELAALGEDAATARSHTDGPLWGVAARIPQIGPNLDAVARISAGLDDVANGVVPTLLDTRAALTGMERTAEGGVDLTALGDLAPRLATAQTTVAATTAGLADLDAARLLPEIADPLVTLRAQLDDVADAVGTADRAATLLPPMLGADGPRTYVVLALTNAELRSGGGIPGAALLVRAEAGHLEVVRQVPGTQIGPFATPVADLDPEAAAIFSPRLAMFFQDVTLVPEFPTAASLAAQMWAQSQGEQVDGVLATDPVALAHLLGATGPVDVQVPGTDEVIRVDADNAVALLENGVYGYEAEVADAADAFFAAVVSATTQRLQSADVDAGALLDALDAAADEHRVQVWSAHADEQERLTGTVLAGTFLSSPRAADAVGVFFDDAVAGKMSWFLESSVAYVGSQCSPAGRLDTFDVTLTSTAPADAATSLPAYVAGLPTGSFTPGTVRTVLRVAGPVGSPTPQLQRDGRGLGLDTHPLAGRSVASGTITLAPGQTTTVRVTALASADASAGAGPQPSGTLDIWSTPTAHDGGLRTVAVPICGVAGETG